MNSGPVVVTGVGALPAVSARRCAALAAGGGGFTATGSLRCAEGRRLCCATWHWSQLACVRLLPVESSFEVCAGPAANENLCGPRRQVVGDDCRVANLSPACGTAPG